MSLGVRQISILHNIYLDVVFILREDEEDYSLLEKTSFPCLFRIILCSSWASSSNLGIFFFSLSLVLDYYFGIESFKIVFTFRTVKSLYINFHGGIWYCSLLNLNFRAFLLKRHNRHYAHINKERIFF